MEWKILRAVSFSRELTDEELQSFTELLTVSEVKPREQIIEEGSAIQSLFIIMKGTVHVRRTAQNREMLLGRISAGEFFGEINLFEAGLATASVYAVDHVSLAAVEYRVLREFMESNPVTGYKIVSGLMAELSRRLRQTNERFVNSMYWSSLSASPESSQP